MRPVMSKSFSDIPAHQDEFNIKNYIQGLAKFIMECETPLTSLVRILAPGSGNEPGADVL